MSKSTPVNRIQENIKETDNENKLVNEILKEIETEQKPIVTTEHLEPSQPPAPPEPTAPPAPQAPPAPSVNDSKPKLETHDNTKEYELDEKESESKDQDEDLETENFKNNNSFVDKLMIELRSPIIVLLVCVFISLPLVNVKLHDFISSKEALQNYIPLLLVLVKGVIGGVMYFGLNKFV